MGTTLKCHKCTYITPRAHTCREAYFAWQACGAQLTLMDLLKGLQWQAALTKAER